MTTERRRRFILQIAVSPFGSGVGWAAHVVGHDSNQCHVMMADLLTKLKLPNEFGAVHDAALSDANLRIGVYEGNLTWAMWLNAYIRHTNKSGFVVNLTTERIP